MLYFYISLKALRNGYSSSSVPHQNICCSRMVSNLIQWWCSRQILPEEHCDQRCGRSGAHQLHHDVLRLHPPQLRLGEKSGEKRSPIWAEINNSSFCKDRPKILKYFYLLMFQIKQKKFDVLDKQVGLEVKYYIFNNIFVST